MLTGGRSTSQGDQNSNFTLEIDKSKCSTKTAICCFQVKISIFTPSHNT